MSLRVTSGGGRSPPAPGGLCHVCGDERRNPLLTCSACKSCVHACCYGITSLPNGRWTCDVCTSRAASSGTMAAPSCCLCSKPGGAMKQCEAEGRDDSQGEATRPWAHLLCVHWDDAAWVNPEDLATMGPIRFHHRRLRAPANISSESNCVICKVPGSLTVRCQRAGCNKHVHPSCARNDRKAYICTEASMGHHFRSVFCPTHGRDGITGLTLLEDLRSQVPDLLEKEIGGGLRQVARSIKVCKKVDTAYERLHSGSFYRHPRDLAQDFEKLLTDLPDARGVLEEFDKMYARWLKGMLPKGVRPTDAAGSNKIGVVPSGSASPQKSKRQETTAQVDGITSWDGDMMVFQHGLPKGFGIKASSRSASSAIGQEESSKRRKQEEQEKHEEALSVDGAEDMEVAWKDDDGGGEANKQAAEDLDLDVVCEVCRGGEALLDDNIVACDGCDTAVHQSCYGIEEVPEGDWFCARCVAERNGSMDGVSKVCYFCGLEGGAMKSTQDGKLWGHVSCVWSEPDVYFQDILLMQPILFRRKIPPPARKAGPCCFCHRPDVGICIQCRWADCNALFHAQCAKDHGGLVKIDQHLGSLLTQTYCGQHKDGRVDPWELMKRVRAVLDPTPTVKTIEAIEGKLGRQTYQSYDAYHRDMMPVLQALEAQGAREVHSEVSYRMSVLKDYLRGRPAKRRNQ